MDRIYAETRWHGCSRTSSRQRPSFVGCPKRKVTLKRPSPTPRPAATASSCGLSGKSTAGRWCCTSSGSMESRLTLTVPGTGSCRVLSSPATGPTGTTRAGKNWKTCSAISHKEGGRDEKDVLPVLRTTSRKRM